MSRGIKFRLWDKQAKKMLYYDKDIVPNMTLNGVLVEPMPALIDGKETTIEGNVSFKYEIMQYTGLKDKNGKEIYEGDIVKECAWFDWQTVNRDWRSGSVIVWDKNHLRFACKGKDGELDCFDMNSKCGYEVTGNIYENPELLTSSTKQK